MLRLVPNGISSLFRVLGEHFPPKRSPAAEHRTYVRHLLRVSEDIPPLRDRIFAIIVDKMIQIDVGYRRVPKFSPYGSVRCACAQRPACVTPVSSPAEHCKQCSALHARGYASPSRAC